MAKAGDDRELQRVRALLQAVSELRDRGGGELVADGSVTRWIRALKAGDLQAVQPLWDRYFEQLVRLARDKLRGRKGCAGEDEEDAALEAFESFCAGVARGQFPRLEDRTDLWRLLAIITARKASAQVRRQRRQKRGGGRVRGEADLAGLDYEGEIVALEQVISREPTPEFATQVAEQCRLLLDRLDDDVLRQVALWRMEGHELNEIADRLGCSGRTVARRIDRIRKCWLKSLG